MDIYEDGSILERSKTCFVLVASGVTSNELWWEVNDISDKFRCNLVSQCN